MRFNGEADRLARFLPLLLRSNYLIMREEHTSKVVCIAQLVIRLEATLLVSNLPKGGIMAGDSYPEISCTICSKPVDLRIDLYADENGGAVHKKCYINRLISAPDNRIAS